MAKRCYAIGGRINFNEYNISLCHGIDIGDKIIWSYGCDEKFTPDYYLRKTRELDEANEKVQSPCEGCSNLIEGQPKSRQIEIITFNMMNFCQNRCVYCTNFDGEIRELYNPLPIIKEFMAEGLIADNCLFDWGGGEPTLSTCFEEIFLFLLNNGYMQRVNTNAVLISDVVLDNLNESLISLRISIDSGNEKTFLATKGRNLFNQVVKNIKEYSSRTRNVVLKYVITSTNSDRESIEDFVNLAISLGIETVCIDTEMLSFGWNDYEGLLRFTEKELEAAHLLRKLAYEKGLKVQIGYVWTAQDNKVPSRDFNNINKISELNESNERYNIPSELLPLHREKKAIYKNDIVAKVLASFETLLVEMKNKKVVLYGAGNNCRQLYECLKRHNIKVTAVCDKFKSGEYFENIMIEDIRDILGKIDNETNVIVTPYCAKTIIAEFNMMNYVVLRGKLYYIDAFRYSARALEI